MSRIIIDNRSQCNDVEALYYAMQVVQQGRISENESYCAVTTFTNGVRVFGMRNKKSDKLIITEGSL